MRNKESLNVRFASFANLFSPISAKVLNNGQTVESEAAPNKGKTLAENLKIVCPASRQSVRLLF